MVQLYTVIFHFLLYSSSIMCLNQTVNRQVAPVHKPGRSTYHLNNNNIKASSRPISKPKVTTAVIKPDTVLKNVSALPTKGEFDHTHRPGVVVWKVPQVKPEQAKDSKQVLLGPIYRLPLDNDDSGSLIQMEWNYVNLKVRPENLTLEAIGPNKAAWSITTMEGTATKATWDLRATPSYSPLIEGYYTIHLHDQRGPGTLPKPGWLLPDKSLKIALYKADGNNHVGEFIAPSQCATCFKHVMQDMGKWTESSAVMLDISASLVIFCLGWVFFYVFDRIGLPFSLAL